MFYLLNSSLSPHKIHLNGALQSHSLQFEMPKRGKLQCMPVSASTVSPSLVDNAEMYPSLANKWREIQGCCNWEGLIEPLNPLLRYEIIRYGEFVVGCYKAFDLDPNSKRYLNCKYGKNKVLREVGMENCGYDITKYIYAAPGISIPVQNGMGCSRWVGYVAVSSDDEVRRLGRRDILVTFRGTITYGEWVANFMSSMIPARLDSSNQREDVMVESGFLNLYTSDDCNSKFGQRSCREQLLSELSRIINAYKDEELSITLAGHSMGSSLAMLLAYDIAELGLNRNESNRDMPIAVYSFGGPRVGNSTFKERCEDLNVKVLRIVNVNDPITKVPGVFLNENFSVLGNRCYAHVGVELALDFFNIQNPSCVHDLEAYINLVKVPKRMQEKDFSHLVNMTRKILMFNKKLEIPTWQNATKNFVNLVEASKIRVEMLSSIPYQLI